MAGGAAPLVSVSHPLGVGLPPLSVGLWLRLLTRTFAARRERACQPPFHDVHPLSRARLRAAQPTGSRQPHSFIRLYLVGNARGFRYRRRCLGRSRSYTHSTSAAEENQQQSGQGWQGVPASVLYTSAYSLYYIVGVVPTITVVYPDVPGILAGILMCWRAQVGKAANRKSANYSKTKPRYLQHLEATPVQPDTSRLDTTTIPSPSTSSTTGSGTVGGFRPPKLPPVRGSGRKAGSQSARVAVKARPQVSALAAHMPPAVPPPSSFANNGAATAR